MGEEKDFYTATEAMNKLGLAKAVFYRKVDTGQIPKRTRPGRKQGVYPKRDIDALAEALNTVFEKNSRFIFSKSSPGDQKEEYEISFLWFGDGWGFYSPLSQRIIFQAKNEYTFMSLKVEGRVVGYISWFRFPPRLLDNMLTGKDIERGFTVKDVLKFPRHDPFDIYIDAVVMDKRLSLPLRRFYAGILVSRIAGTILDLRSNGYHIRTLYTVPVTPESDTLIRKLGFRLMEGKSLNPSRPAYRYDLDEGNIRRLEHLSRRNPQ